MLPFCNRTPQYVQCFSLGEQVYHILWFLHVRPASQFALTVVALCERNVGDPCSRHFSLHTHPLPFAASVLPFRLLVLSVSELYKAVVFLQMLSPTVAKSKSSQELTEIYLCDFEKPGTFRVANRVLRDIGRNEIPSDTLNIRPPTPKIITLQEARIL
jgi:hypothetical protein